MDVAFALRESHSNVKRSLFRSDAVTAGVLGCLILWRVITGVNPIHEPRNVSSRSRHLSPVPFEVCHEPFCGDWMTATRHQMSSPWPSN